MAAWGAPLVWMVSTSLKPSSQVMTREIEWLPHEITFANYAKVLEYPVATWAFNSVIVAAASTALSVLFGAMAGYAIARLSFPGRRVLFSAFRLDDDPAGGRRRAAADRDDRSGLGQHLSGADPADDRERAQRLRLPAVLPDLPAQAEEAALVDGASLSTSSSASPSPLARSPVIGGAAPCCTLNWNNFPVAAPRSPSTRT